MLQSDSIETFKMARWCVDQWKSERRMSEKKTVDRKMTMGKAFGLKFKEKVDIMFNDKLVSEMKEKMEKPSLRMREEWKGFVI